MTAQHVGSTWNKGKLLGAKSPLRTCLGDPKPQLEGQATLPCSILPSTAILKGPSKKPDPADLLTEQTREAGWVVEVTDRSAWKKCPVYWAIFLRHAFSHP
jgi:hypothetical protein